MPSRVALSLRSIFCLLIILMCVPNSGVLAQNVKDSKPQGIDQPTGGLGNAKANQEAIETLRRMTPGEIKALDEKLEKALTLYYDQEYARALPIFLEISDKVETMDVIFWTGTCAMKMGRHQLAIQKYQKILSIDSNLHRVRLELAFVYFNMENYDKAREELKLVMAASPPEGVQANIEKLYTAIEEKTRRVTWKLRLAQGYLFDDNINTGPDPATYNFPGGTTFTPAALSAKLRDEALVTSVFGNMLYKIRKELLWSTTALFYNKAYLKYSQFNFLAVDLSTGPVWLRRNGLFRVPVGVMDTEYGSDRLSRTFHVGPTYEHKINRFLGFKGLYSYEEEKYFVDTQAATLDNLRHRFEITPSLYLKNRRHILSFTVGYDDTDARSDTSSYRDPYFTVSYFAGFKNGLEFFTRYTWTRKEYLETLGFPYTNKYRIDKYQNWSAMLSKNVYKKIYASFAYNYADNRSSLDLYSYDKNTFTISAELRF